MIKGVYTITDSLGNTTSDVKGDNVEGAEGEEVDEKLPYDIGEICIRDMSIVKPDMLPLFISPLLYDSYVVGVRCYVIGL